jgi:predicted metal-dependent hydrolase
VFECARARRIARHAPDSVRGHGIDPDEFSGVMDGVAAHRNVMEHWADVINPRKPKIHRHTTPEGLRITVDEVSWIIMGPEQIYKGKLNLYDVYVYIVAKLNHAQEA